MNVENAQIQMRKGILDFCILHIIGRGEIYSSNILEELTSAKMMIVEGTLYPLLTRLKNTGLVEYRWIESQSGPPRKYFTITDKGTEILAELSQTWLEMANSVTNILATNTPNQNIIQTK